MKTMKFLFVLMMVLCTGSAMAQKRFVVADVETLVPIQGVNVVGKGFTIQTDSLGLCELPDSSKSLVLSHVNYESRIVNTDEINDTIFLISKLLMVNGVVVFGHGKNQDRLAELKKRLSFSKNELELMAADPGRGTDLLKLFNYLLPKRKKMSRKQKLKQVLKEY